MEKKIINVGTKGLGLVGIGYGIIVTAEKVVVALSRTCESNPTCLNEALTLGLTALAIIGSGAFIIRKLKK